MKEIIFGLVLNYVFFIISSILWLGIYCLILKFHNKNGWENTGVAFFASYLYLFQMGFTFLFLVVHFMGEVKILWFNLFYLAVYMLLLFLLRFCYEPKKIFRDEIKETSKKHKKTKKRSDLKKFSKILKQKGQD
jgi:hypothetical protein